MKTIVTRKEEHQPQWFLLDASGCILGRFASKVAFSIKGKDNPRYSTYQGDNKRFVIINASKIRVTGRKIQDKMYYHHTGYPGGLKSISFEKVMEKDSCFPLKKAIKGMLPKNRLGRSLFKQLRIYSGAEHPHEAQKMKLIEF